MPDYKDSFPQWSGQSMAKLVPGVDDQGLDLLEVRTANVMCVGVFVCACANLSLMIPLFYGSKKKIARPHKKIPVSVATVEGGRVSMLVQKFFGP